MKLDVPYYKSKKETDCGPLALKMVLSYFGKDKSFQDISKEEKQLDTGLVWSLGIARAAKVFGFSVKLISISNFTHEENDLEYYKKYSGNKGMLMLKELEKDVKILDVQVEKRDMTLDELLTHVRKDSLPIVLLNWFSISTKEGFSGHFVPIVGYDSKNVYVHNPGLLDAKPYMQLGRAEFVKAWESKGTDKDTIIIFK